ncbi:MAG: hypothetical protein ACLUD0_07165 [Eubacterium ramulus]
MERTYGIGIILGVCGLILLIGILKKNAEILLNSLWLGRWCV